MAGSRAKERPIGSKRPERRELLKTGAALAGGLTLGAVAPASGQTAASTPLPLNRGGTLTADELYALTAFLLYINDVIPEDEVLDAQGLPKIKMPIGDAYASLPD